MSERTNARAHRKRDGNTRNGVESCLDLIKYFIVAEKDIYIYIFLCLCPLSSSSSLASPPMTIKALKAGWHKRKGGGKDVGETYWPATGVR